VFIHEAYVDTIKESSTSRLGHLRDSATIYPEIGDVDSATEVTLDQLEYVYYIKKQADIGSTRYYLIGKQPNTRNEVIGWVKATDIQTHLHTGIDTIPKTLIANGRGQAFTKA